MAKTKVLTGCSTSHYPLCPSPASLRTRGLSPSSEQPFCRPWGHPLRLLAKGGTASAQHKLQLTAETTARNPIPAWKLQKGIRPSRQYSSTTHTTAGGKGSREPGALNPSPRLLLAAPEIWQVPLAAELPAEPTPPRGSGSCRAKPRVPHLLYPVRVSTGKCLCCCCHPKGLSPVMCVLDKGAGAGLLLDAAVAAGEVCPGWAAFQQSTSTERMSSA